MILRNARFNKKEVITKFEILFLVLLYKFKEMVVLPNGLEFIQCYEKICILNYMNSTVFWDMTACR